jgi:hypothetical protein
VCVCVSAYVSIRHWTSIGNRVEMWQQGKSAADESEGSSALAAAVVAAADTHPLALLYLKGNVLVRLPAVEA